jgi:hypothetical protein
VPVATLLPGTIVVPVDDSLGRCAGMLQARNGGSNTVDATVVCLATVGDDILILPPVVCAASPTPSAATSTSSPSRSKPAVDVQAHEQAGAERSCPG